MFDSIDQRSNIPSRSQFFQRASPVGACTAEESPSLWTSDVTGLVTSWPAGWVTGRQPPKSPTCRDWDRPPAPCTTVRWGQAVSVHRRFQGRGVQPGHDLPKGQNSNIFLIKCLFVYEFSLFKKIMDENCLLLLILGWGYLGPWRLPHPKQNHGAASVSWHYGVCYATFIIPTRKKRSRFSFQQSETQIWNCIACWEEFTVEIYWMCTYSMSRNRQWG